MLNRSVRIPRSCHGVDHRGAGEGMAGQELCLGFVNRRVARLRSPRQPGRSPSFLKYRWILPAERDPLLRRCKHGGHPQPVPVDEGDLVGLGKLAKTVRYEELPLLAGNHIPDLLIHLLGAAAEGHHNVPQRTLCGCAVHVGAGCREDRRKPAIQRLCALADGGQMKGSVFNKEEQPRRAPRIVADQRNKSTPGKNGRSIGGRNVRHRIRQPVQLVPIGEALLLQRQLLREDRAESLGHRTRVANLQATVKEPGVVLLHLR